MPKEPELKTYAVTWDATTEQVSTLEAARECWRMMRDPDSIANVFMVTDEEGNVTQVDLMAEGTGEEAGSPADVSRQALHDDVWLHVESSIEGYADIIDQLIAFMPDELLARFVEKLNDSEDEDDPFSD